MTDLELGWLAGLLEGEGCFTTSGRSRPGQRRAPRVAVYLVSTDEDVVRRAAALLNANVMTVKTTSSWSRKPQFRIVLTGGRAIDLMRTVLPLLGERRAARVNELLAHAEADS